MRHRYFGAEVIYCESNILKHRCYCAEVILFFYFVFSSGAENRTLSQMCGSLYMQIFLLRVGLLTLMYIVSFTALAIFCPSLPIILKLSTAVVWPVVLVTVLLNVL